MNKRKIPSWALPTLETVGLDYKTVRGILGGQARARKLSPEHLHRIAMKGVKARREQTTPEQRRAHASHAGRIGNAKRWAGHVKKQKPPKLTKEQRAEINRRNGSRGLQTRWGTGAPA